jgi:hypothetical protein
MADVSSDTKALAEKVRLAFAAHDFEAFGVLLTDDVRWGEDDNPRSCRNRKQVLATFANAVARGMDGTIGEIVPGTKGILCRLDINQAPQHQGRLEDPLYHVYLVKENRIYVIEPHHDRASAARAAGAD